MDFTPLLDTKGFFRFTGPPEHWLYAVKYMTWGLEEKHKVHWQRIQPGDVFFIHSTRNSYFPNAKSGIIGLGVVGSDFSIKKDLRWLHNQEMRVTCREMRRRGGACWRWETYAYDSVYGATGPTRLDFGVLVRFPRSDLVTIVRRLRANNRSPTRTSGRRRCA